MGELAPLQSTRGASASARDPRPLSKFSVLPAWYGIVLRSDTGRGWLPPASGGLPASLRLRLTSAPRRKRPAGPQRLCLLPPVSSPRQRPGPPGSRATTMPCAAPGCAFRKVGLVRIWGCGGTSSRGAHSCQSTWGRSGKLGDGGAAPTGRPALPSQARGLPAGTTSNGSERCEPGASGRGSACCPGLRPGLAPGHGPAGPGDPWHVPSRHPLSPLDPMASCLSWPRSPLRRAFWIARGSPLCPGLSESHHSLQRPLQIPGPWPWSCPLPPRAPGPRGSAGRPGQPQKTSGPLAGPLPVKKGGVCLGKGCPVSLAHVARSEHPLGSSWLAKGAFPQ